MLCLCLWTSSPLCRAEGGDPGPGCQKVWDSCFPRWTVVLQAPETHWFQMKCFPVKVQGMFLMKKLFIFQTVKWSCFAPSLREAGRWLWVLHGATLMLNCPGFLLFTEISQCSCTGLFFPPKVLEWPQRAWGRVTALSHSACSSRCHVPIRWQCTNRSPSERASQAALALLSLTKM